MEDIISYRDVESKIIEIRGEKVILDSDVAKLYGVETMHVNQAVKNNPDKFPEGYIFTLSKEEKAEVIKIFDNLRSNQEVVEIFDGPKVKFSPVLPKAFTEKGLYMLATILKSPVATQTTIAIVETFTKMRELTRVINVLGNEKDGGSLSILTQKSGALLTDMFGDGSLNVSGDETSVELNLGVMKLKHTVKREKR